MSVKWQGEIALRLIKVQIVKDEILEGKGNFQQYMQKISEKSGVSVDELSRFYMAILSKIQDKIFEKKRAPLSIRPITYIQSN